MGLGKREKNFERYLAKHFEIELPKEVGLFYAKGVRIGNKELMKSKIHGELGYAACDFGFNPTNALIQNFGYLARKNIVEVKEEEAKEFANGKGIKRDLGTKSKHIIVKYKEHVVGLGFYSKEQKKVLNKIPEKRRREIINEIA